MAKLAGPVPGPFFLTFKSCYSVLLAIFFETLFLFGGLSGIAQPSAVLDPKDQHFIFNNGAEPETLDPALATGQPEFRLINALFEGLTTLHPQSLEVLPGIAKSWDISQDKKTYTFHLRENSRWSNGRPLTAMHIQASWMRTLDPGTGSAYAYQLYPIKGAREYHDKTAKSFADVGVKAINDHTLVVQLNQVCHYFLDLCAFPTLFPVPLELIAQHKDRWVRPEHIISNGPFTLVEWSPREQMVFQKNRHYWNSPGVHLQKISALACDNPDTAYKMFLKNELHWLPGLPMEKLNEIRVNPDYYFMPAFGSYFYRFNCTQKPFSDAKVRKAFSISIDRSIITEQILKGGEQPATWYCPSIGGYQHVQGCSPNTVLARKLLQEAGYHRPADFPVVELLYNTSESHKIIAESIVQQWRINLGIKVVLRNAEWKVFLNDMNSLNYSICRSSWYGDYGDPRTFLDIFTSNGGNNRTGWKNNRYDQLLGLSDAEPDPTTRYALLHEMESILVEKEFPILPIYMYVTKGLLKERVAGWHENNRDHHPFQYIWMEPL